MLAQYQLPRGASMAWAIVARRALSPSTPRARGAPYGLRGLTAQRGQASGYHANNAKKRLSGYPAAFSTGTRLKSRSPRSVTNFVSHTWGAVQFCHLCLGPLKILILSVIFVRNEMRNQGLRKGHRGAS